MTNLKKKMGESATGRMITMNLAPVKKPRKKSSAAECERCEKRTNPKED